jgi:hypothetical protein
MLTLSPLGRWLEAHLAVHRSLSSAVCSLSSPAAAIRFIVGRHFNTLVISSGFKLSPEIRKEAVEADTGPPNFCQHGRVNGVV